MYAGSLKVNLKQLGIVRLTRPGKEFDFSCDHRKNFAGKESKCKKTGKRVSQHFCNKLCSFAPNQ